MSNFSPFNPSEETKKIVDHLTENAKFLNENQSQFDYMFDYVDAVEHALLNAGFDKAVLSDMTIFMVKNLKIEADNSELKKQLHQEVTESDFLTEVAKMHFYLYSQFDKKGYSHLHIMELLSAFQ